MFGGCRRGWTGFGEAVGRLDRKSVAFVVLLAVGCANLVLEQRRNQLAWRELPGTAGKAAVGLAEAPRVPVVETQRPDGVNRSALAKRQGAAKGSPAPAGPVGGAAGRAELVDLNRASARELDGLPGLGPALARRVVEYREANGLYRSVADLERVAGIGPVRLARLAGLVRVGEAAGPAGGR